MAKKKNMLFYLGYQSELTASHCDTTNPLATDPLSLVCMAKISI